MLVLHEGDRIQAATDNDGHAVGDNLLRGRRDSHHAGSTLAIHAHARYGTG